MNDKHLLAKVFDVNEIYLGCGTLSSLDDNILTIKGENLPLIPINQTVLIYIYDEFLGVKIHECKINIASEKQINATVIKQFPFIDRRLSLKVRTDIVALLSTVIRENSKIVCHRNKFHIHINNLSIKGMRIDTDHEFKIDDILTTSFGINNTYLFSIQSRIVRCDGRDNYNKLNYGCVFYPLPLETENIICRYLFERQLALFKEKNN